MGLDQELILQNALHLPQGRVLTLTLSMAQRLVRKPCQECVVHSPADADTRRRLGMTDIEATACVASVGCRSCGMSGYAGRIGLYEMLPISRGVRAALIAGAGETAITSAAMGEGFRSLQRLGVEAAVSGLTTPAELLRTLSVDAEALSAV